MSCWPRLRNGARQNCKTRSADSPMQVWCFSTAYPRTPRFLFKHALVQDAAYGTLLRGPRQVLHAQIAEALETHSPETDRQPTRTLRPALRRGRARRKICRSTGARPVSAPPPARRWRRRPRNSKRAGPAGAVAGQPRTSATGTRISQFPGRGVALCQRPGRAGSRSCLCPRTRAVGAVGFSLRVPSRSLWAVSLSRVPRRIRFGVAPG